MTDCPATATRSRLATVLAVTTLVLLQSAVAGAAEHRKRHKPASAPASTPVTTAAAAAPSRPAVPATRLAPRDAATFAGLALACIDRPYPYKPDRVLAGASAVREPRLDHPAFYGCFDWHSAMHAHWMLVRLSRLFPKEPFAADARAALAVHLSPAAMQGETTFLSSADQSLFERPYGWAWGLALARELHLAGDPEAALWAKSFEPLEQALVTRFKEYLPKLSFPVRAGTHANTAFALALALDYAATVHDDGLAELARDRARSLYSDDRDCPVAYEPGGEDFFPPCLLEADLMRRVLPAADYSRWLDAFLPGVRSGQLGKVLGPAEVTDPSDGRIVHLDGLNLARAWTLRGIASALPQGDARRATLSGLAARHAEAGLARVASGHYEGEHWLASFAVYLETDAGISARR